MHSQVSNSRIRPISAFARRNRALCTDADDVAFNTHSQPDLPFSACTWEVLSTLFDGIYSATSRRWLRPTFGIRQQGEENPSCVFRIHRASPSTHAVAQDGRQRAYLLNPALDFHSKAVAGGMDVMSPSRLGVGRSGTDGLMDAPPPSRRTASSAATATVEQSPSRETPRTFGRTHSSYALREQIGSSALGVEDAESGSRERSHVTQHCQC